jgi:MFS family permease
MALLSLGTIMGCLAAPLLAERFGRKLTLALYFLGMGTSIVLSFGWAFYQARGLTPFIAVMFFLGLFGGNFAIFSLWIPEQYETAVRATAFGFTTSFGRFAAAALNFGIGALIGRMGTLGKPVAMTSLAFAIGMTMIPFAVETRGKALPDLRAESFAS